MIEQSINMSIQRDQNLAIRQKEKKEKRPKLGHLSKRKAKTWPLQNIHTNVSK
jgi:hypothetical protein